MAWLQGKDLISVNVGASVVNSGDVTIQLVTGHAAYLPAAPFYMFFPGNTATGETPEFIYVSAVNTGTDQLTIAAPPYGNTTGNGRAALANGTPNNYVATTHAAGAAIQLRSVWEDFQQLQAQIDAHVHDGSAMNGPVLGTSALGSQIVTAAKIANNTITATQIANNTITATQLAAGAATGAALGTDVATLTGTQTLTNKTMDSANNTMTVRNAALATDAYRKNLLINPGFEIWQRATSFSPLGNGGFGADRWEAWINGTASANIFQATRGGSASRFCLQATIAKGATSSNWYAVRQKIEDFTSLRGTPLTFAADINQAFANSTQVSIIWTGGTSPGGSTAVSTATTGAWVRISSTGTPSADCTAIYVVVTMALNDTINTTNNTFVDNATLVFGSQAEDYVPILLADDLARCQRYFQVLGSKTGASAFGDLIIEAYAGGANTFSNTFVYATEMGGVPTVTSVGTWATSNCSAPVFRGFSERALRMETTATGVGQFFVVNSSSGNYITLEWNP